MNQVMNTPQPPTPPPPESSSSSWMNTLSQTLSPTNLSQYFNIDTLDFYNRIQYSVKSANIPDYFRTQVLYSNAVTTGNNTSRSGIDGNNDVDVNVDDNSDFHTMNNNGGRNMMKFRRIPDLYGPIWISMTLVFILAVTSNTFQYIHNKSTSSSSSTSAVDWEYDIFQLVEAWTLIFTYTFVIPIVIYTISSCLRLTTTTTTTTTLSTLQQQQPGMTTPSSPSLNTETNLSFVDILSIYGYSLTIYIPGCMIISFLSLFLASHVSILFYYIEWMILLCCTAWSCNLIVRNVSGPFLYNNYHNNNNSNNSVNGGAMDMNHQNVSGGGGKVGGMLLLILLCHGYLILALKWKFYNRDYNIGGGDGDGGNQHDDYDNDDVGNGGN